MIVSLKRNHPTYVKKKTAENDHLKVTLATAGKFKASMLKHGKTTAYTHCPVCKKKLFGSLAPKSNHLHMKCESANCIIFME